MHCYLVNWNFVYILNLKNKNHDHHGNYNSQIFVIKQLQFEVTKNEHSKFNGVCTFMYNGTVYSSPEEKKILKE